MSMGPRRWSVTGLMKRLRSNLSLLDEVEQAARTVKGSETLTAASGNVNTRSGWTAKVLIRANQLDFPARYEMEGVLR